MSISRCAALAVAVSVQSADAISLLRGPKVSPLPYENHHEHLLVERDPKTDRLSDACEEPKDPPRAADGEGPVTVRCCHSAKSKVEHFLKREKDCHDAVPCSKSWQEMLPSYIDYYKELEATLCKPRPTTTTTTTTTWTIPPLKEEKEEPKEKEEEKKEKPEKEEKEDSLAWCKEPCLELATDDKDKCEKLCEELEGKVDEKMAAAGCEAKSSTVTKVTKVTKTTTSDGETKVTKEESVSKKEDGAVKEEASEEEPAESADEKEEETNAEEPAEDAKAEEPQADAKADEEPKADEKAEEEEAPKEEAAADEGAADGEEEAAKDEESE